MSYLFYIPIVSFFRHFFKKSLFLFVLSRKLSAFIQNGLIFQGDTCEIRNQPGSRAPKMKIFPIFFIKLMTFELKLI
jgi:hypothetical protein